MLVVRRDNFYKNKSSKCLIDKKRRIVYRILIDETYVDGGVKAVVKELVVVLSANRLLLPKTFH